MEFIRYRKIVGEREFCVVNCENCFNSFDHWTRKLLFVVKFLLNLREVKRLLESLDYHSWWLDIYWFLT